MKENFKKIIAPIIIILIIFMVLIIILTKRYYIEKNETIENKEISKLKNEIGVQGQDDIYEVINETGTQQILNVKEEVKFKIALAGMLKQTQPNFDEVDEILKENQFLDTGIYINTDSRQKFMNLIEKFTKGKYQINEKGYLEIVDDSNINEEDELLKKLINSQELLIIDFSDKCYTVDEVTGEIIDYPFEIMDPYQVSQIYKQENKTLVFITTNLKGKLNEKEIFSEILDL